MQTKLTVVIVSSPSGWSRTSGHPNATRLLKRWKVSHRLEKLSSSPKTFTIHRYKDGTILGKRENYGEEMLEKYKSPFWDMHRADLQIALFERAKELGVNFRLGALVGAIDLETPSATLASGECIEGDLIVAADGDLAYRVILQVDDIKDDSLRTFFQTPRVALWARPDCHAICYPLKGNSFLNIVLLVPDNLPDGVMRESGDLSEMQTVFKDWDPRLLTLLSMVPKVDKWKLMHLGELEHWHNEEATIAFLGDACHPMLPYLAQGAGSSLEDGAALGVLLSTASRRQDLPKALKSYEQLRKTRSSALQKRSMIQRHINHLANGPEQQQRDEILLQQMGEPQPGYPFYWLDPIQQSFVYGYDVYEELERLGFNSVTRLDTAGEVYLQFKI
ncbi:hypothetical protein DL95DRAFT_428931 [Leptodontidium sp. 2 PMI_412]|nr:hypothetical protein DL95DRAFT_428931 [Leptodontidium sp. 2 PMI_412]